MIDNKEKIKPLLIFPHKDCFYFIQILQRKKDHPEGTVVGSNNNSRLIKAYFIKSVDQLEKQWKEMVLLADLFDARVSINLNPRSFVKAGFHLLQKVANQMSNGDFENIHKAYTSVCGEYHAEIDKRWIIDIDTQDLNEVRKITETIVKLHEKVTNKPYTIMALLPSKSGYHVISNPFNLEEFAERCPGIEVHKNNPTNLYIP